jgi:hypothetical protein
MEQSWSALHRAFSTFLAVQPVGFIASVRALAAKWFAVPAES